MPPPPPHETNIQTKPRKLQSHDVPIRATQGFAHKFSVPLRPSISLRVNVPNFSFLRPQMVHLTRNASMRGPDVSVNVSQRCFVTNYNLQICFTIS